MFAHLLFDKLIVLVCGGQSGLGCIWLRWQKFCRVHAVVAMLCSRHHSHSTSVRVGAAMTGSLFLFQAVEEQPRTWLPAHWAEPSGSLVCPLPGWSAPCWSDPCWSAPCWSDPCVINNQLHSYQLSDAQLVGKCWTLYSSGSVWNCDGDFVDISLLKLLWQLAHFSEGCCWNVYTWKLFWGLFWTCTWTVSFLEGGGHAHFRVLRNCHRDVLFRVL